MGLWRSIPAPTWRRNAPTEAASATGAEASAASSFKAIREGMVSDPFEALPRLDGVFHYMPIRKMDAALKLGWMPLPALMHTHHGEHAVLCHWVPCDHCQMRVP